MEVGGRFVVRFHFDEVVDDAEDAVFQDCDMEVDDEAEAEIKEAQVGEDFQFVDGGDLVFGLEVNDDFPFDDQIRPQIDRQPHAFVNEWHRSLPHKRKPAQVQL